MNYRLTNKALTVAIALVCTISTNSFAQNSAQSSQPVVGSVHQREAYIQRKMQKYYEGGLIDSAELANFQRDFDGICVKEDAARVTPDGLTNTARNTTMHKLARFETNLDAHANKSGVPIAPPAEPK